MPHDLKQHDLTTADPHRTVDAPCDGAALDRAIRALSGDTNTVVLAQALSAGAPLLGQFGDPATAAFPRT